MEGRKTCLWPIRCRAGSSTGQPRATRNDMQLSENELGDDYIFQLGVSQSVGVNSFKDYVFDVGIGQPRAHDEQLFHKLMFC